MMWLKLLSGRFRCPKDGGVNARSGRRRSAPFRRSTRAHVYIYHVQAVPTPQQEKLFNTYMQAVQQLQAQAQERASRARAGFQVIDERRLSCLPWWNVPECQSAGTTAAALLVC